MTAAMALDIDEAYLKPGEFFFGAGHVRVGTLLGSCVTVTLWHPTRHLGGMCHFMLPSRPRLPRQAPDGRYANEAFELFDRAIARHGTQAADYQAKLFGGGNMFPRQQMVPAHDIGRKNIESGRSLLQQRGIRLLREHVGGAGHRKLYFDIWSGEVWLNFQETNPIPPSCYG